VVVVGYEGVWSRDGMEIGIVEFTYYVGRGRVEEEAVDVVLKDLNLVSDDFGSHQRGRLPRGVKVLELHPSQWSMAWAS
jgi:hypothetical protein